jgi:hypothetical protein
MARLSQILNQLQTERRQVQGELSRLNSAINALRGLNTSNHTGKTGNGSTRPRRTLSVAARKKIASAQRARWAAWKAKQKKAA